MKFLSTQTQPNKTTIPGVYPILDEKEALTCSIESLIQGSANNNTPIILTEQKSFIIPPSEDDIPPGYVCGIYEYIQGKTGSNWSQETTYPAYNNPQYWGTNQSVNEWIRSGETLTFNIYEIIGESKTLVSTQVFNVYDLLYKSDKYKKYCSNINLFSVEGNNIRFHQDVELIPNGFGAKGKIPAGFYDLENAPGSPNVLDSLAPGSIWVDTFQAPGPSGYTYTYRIVLGTLQQAMAMGPCTISRQVLFGGWANTGAYGLGNYRTVNWNICDNPNVFIPLCANCE